MISELVIFYLWQAAYAEFYFTEVLWPDFNEALNLTLPLSCFDQRERRFGKTGEQARDNQAIILSKFMEYYSKNNKKNCQMATASLNICNFKKLITIIRVYFC